MTLDTRKIRLVMTLRDAGITDPRVLGAVESVPREAFVPAYLRERAYENVALPIGHGQTISQPIVVAQMTAALAVGERMTVLEIGTGSGYQTAILARLARRIYTIELHGALQKEAVTRLETLRLRNVTARIGDGTLGWPQAAPFDRIIAAAVATEVPAALADQLAENGVMVIPIGRPGGSQELVRLERVAGSWVETTLGFVQFVPFVHRAVSTARAES